MGFQAQPLPCQSVKVTTLQELRDLVAMCREQCVAAITVDGIALQFAPAAFIPARQEWQPPARTTPDPGSDAPRGTIARFRPVGVRPPPLRTRDMPPAEKRKAVKRG